MKAVLISIRPEWCDMIMSGIKTLEVRKTKPKIEVPFKCYIYCTQPKTKDPWKTLELHTQEKAYRCNGKVVAEFTCDHISQVAFMYYDGLVDVVDCDTSCLSAKEILDYAGGQIPLYGWHISKLKVYEKPKELSAIKGLKKCKFGWAPYELTRAPQSWQYVEGLETNG